MSNKKDKPSLDQLVRDEPEDNILSPMAPLIRVSLPHVCGDQHGIDNLSFSLNVPERGRTASRNDFHNAGSPVSAVSYQSSTPSSQFSGMSSMVDGLPNLFALEDGTERRSSSTNIAPYPPDVKSNSLSVPGLGIPSVSPTPTLVSQRETVVTPFNTNENQTITIDSLSLPRTPMTHYSSSGMRSPARSTTSFKSTWSELVRLSKQESHDSDDSVFEHESSYEHRKSLSVLSSNLSDRLHELVHAFSSRTERTKERTLQPPTPSSVSSLDLSTRSVISGADHSPSPVQRRRLDSFIPVSRMSDHSAMSRFKDDVFFGSGHCRMKVPSCFQKCKVPRALDPQNKIYLMWLFIVTIAFMYNAWGIMLRAAFPIYQTEDNLVYWLVCDYVCDFIYIVDIIVFKMRVKFLNNGMLETGAKEMRQNYVKKWDFKLDLVSLLPLDFFYFLVGVNPLLRLPRMFKIKTFWEFYDRMDQAAKSGHIIRILRAMTYMLYLIHLETCGYYSISVYEGIGSNSWVYNGEGRAYIRCFYLATKTATSIGNNPKPTNILEHLFMAVYWLSGVFVFALLIGQIRDIYQAAGLVKANYRKTMDATLNYLQANKVPKELQDKVRTWFNYNWEQHKTLDENSLLQALPKKMMTDLAISVHYDTLCKVQLFQDCEKQLLYDLVLKLKPVLYLPGDYICMKGEVGTEMYIVMHGQVEVVSAENVVLATLSEGSVFGEISLLALAGGNRRTANVRSKGFSNLFILSKTDFSKAMGDYPKAQAILKKRAMKLLHQNAKTQEKTTMEAEEIIKSRQGTPKLLKTVIQVAEPDSQIAKIFKKTKKGKGVGKQSTRESTGQSKHKLLGKQDTVQTQDSMDSRDSLDPEDEVLVVEQTLTPLNLPTISEPKPELERPELKHKQVESFDSGLPRSLADEASVDMKATKENLSFDILEQSEGTISSRPSSEKSRKSSETAEFQANIHDLKTSRPSTAPPNWNWDDIQQLNGVPAKTTKTVQRKPKNIPEIVNLDLIPDENKVTCHVLVHREKSLTPSLVTDADNGGVSNLGFEETVMTRTSTPSVSKA